MCTFNGIFLPDLEYVQLMFSPKVSRTTINTQRVMQV